MRYYHGPQCHCPDCSLKRMDSSKASWFLRRDAWRVRAGNGRNVGFWIAIGVATIILIVLGIGQN